MIEAMPYLFLVIIAVIVGLLAWYIEDNRRWRIARKMFNDPESWCYKNCKLHEECFSNHKDPDDAWDELQDYCSKCPMMCAVEEMMEKDGK